MISDVARRAGKLVSPAPNPGNTLSRLFSLRHYTSLTSSSSLSLSLSVRSTIHYFLSRSGSVEVAASPFRLCTYVARWYFEGRCSRGWPQGAFATTTTSPDTTGIRIVDATLRSVSVYRVTRVETRAYTHTQTGATDIHGANTKELSSAGSS